MRQLAFELAPRPAPTFASFVAGGNGEAKACLEALAAGRSPERSVYLWGERGSGRTHLLRATLAAMEAAGRRCAHVSCTAETTAFPPTNGLDCLVADDVERLPERGQVALFNAYNDLRERAGALVAAGDAPPVQLTLRPDLVTRLGWGLVYHLVPLTDAEKARALADCAKARGFTLSDDVAAYLLHHVERDMGSLLATLEALDRYSLEAKRPVTLPLVRELVRSRAPSSD